MNWAVLVTFLSIQIAIGLWASRRVRSEEDYFVAGRRLGLPLVTMSLFATWFGAESCLGASGAVYERGLSGGRADPFGYAICLVLVGLLFAARLSNGRFLTLGELFRERFGPRTERLAILLLVPSSLLWGAAQIRALGQVLAHTSSLPVEPAIVVSACFVVAYTFVGGLLGDVASDFVQGALLVVALVTLAVAVYVELPSEAIALGFTEERLRLFPADESAWIQLDRWATPIVGSLVTQELVARLLAARSAAVARTGAFGAASIYLVAGSIPIFLGLVGPSLIPGLGDPERLLPELALRYLPPALYVLFVCGLLAAILSTVDSVLLSSSALLAHDLLVPALHVTDERHKILLGRAVVVLAGAFALAVALAADRIYTLVELASTLGTAGISIVTLAALFDRKPSARAAFFALAVGAVTNPLLEYGFAFPAPFLVAVLGSTSTYVLIAWFERAADRRASAPPPPP